MKLIHCSDIHLDSAMDANLSPDKAKIRRRELVDTFERMVDYAKTNSVQAIMISGDLFDSSRISRITLDRIITTMRRAADIDFYCLAGNHDSAVKWSTITMLPENVYLFSSFWKSFDLGMGVCLTGIEPDALPARLGAHGAISEPMADMESQAFYDALELNPDRVNIVMMHGQTSSRPGKDKICLQYLKDKNIDYLALGHLHSYEQGVIDQRGTYCYCGCLEGRGFDECGSKGFVLLEISLGHITSSFVPFAHRRLHNISVDITDCANVVDMADKMFKLSTGIPQEDMVCYDLVGTYEVDTVKDTSYLLGMVSSAFFAVKITDSSKLSIQKEDYQYDESLKGEFTRLIMASKESQADKERILAAGISALRGQDVVL